MRCWDLAHILEVEPAAHWPILAVPEGMAPYLYGGAVALFLAPLVFLYLDDTKIFDVLPQLGGEPVGYLGSCGYRNIEVVSPLEIVAFRAKKLRKTMLSMRVTTVRMMPKMVTIGGVVKMD